MKVQLTPSLVLISGLMSAVFLISCEREKKIEIKTDEQKMSYAIGQQIGQSLKRDNMKVDPVIIGASITDVLNNEKPRLSDQEMQGVMEILREKAASQVSAIGKQNKDAEEKFLAENKKKPNVKSTDSGLQYEIITEGKGALPHDSDEVKVNYRGTMLDGTEFDSTYKSNEPAIMPLGEIIPGWSEAIKMMRVGSKWKIYIPAAQAYGDSGNAEIPPNSLLTFEIELLDIMPKADDAKGAGATGRPQHGSQPEHGAKKKGR